MFHQLLQVIMQKIRITFAFGFLALFCFSACKKDETTGVSDAEKANGQDYALSQSLHTDTWQTMLEMAQQQAGLNGLTETSAESRGACPTVTLTPSTPGAFPKTLVLDFGTGCTTSGGATASGQVTATFSGPLTQSGVSITVSLVNFKYKGYTLSGSYSATIQPAGTYNVTVSSGKVTTPDGKNATFTGTLTFVQVEGKNTPTQTTDDVFSISVNLSGTDTEGKAYTAQTTTPLRKALNCAWIVSGVVEIKTTGQAKKTLDFGQGTCDDSATLQVGPVSTPVKLP